MAIPTRLLGALAVALALLGRAAGAGADAPPPRVVADIAPVHSLVARLMAGVGAPQLLLPPGVSPHAHALRPSEARALAGADLVVWIGPALTPWLEPAIDTLAGGAARLTLAEAPGLRRLPVPGREASGPVDPHLWLDPANARAWLGPIAAALAEADPARAGRYAANAAEAAGELVALEARVAERVAPVRDRPFLVLHDAYRYFEARFGLDAVAAVAGSEAVAPGAARLVAIRRRLAETGAECIFAEPQLGAGAAETVAEGTGARRATLDPIGATLDPGPDLYPRLIEGIAESLADCLGG